MRKRAECSGEEVSAFLSRVRASVRAAAYSARLKPRARAGGAFGEAGGELALGLVELGAAGGEEGLDLFGWKGAEVSDGAAGADGGQELAEVFRHEEDVDVGRRLFEDLQKGVGGFLHEGRRGEEEDPGGGFDR